MPPEADDYTHMTKNKKRLLIGVLLGGSVCITLVVLEIFLRLFLPQMEAEQWFESNPRYGHVLKKNFYQRYRYAEAGVEVDVQTNTLGLRDKEYDLSRKDQKRVLLIGDSFTFGEGLNAEFNFDSKLEALLATEDNGWIVLNSGVGGWGTLQQTLYATDHFALFCPDIIVLTFCGNDPGDDVAFLHHSSDNENGRFYFPGKIFLRNHSHLYRFVFSSFTKVVYNWKMKKKKQEHPDLVLDGQSSTLISEEEWNLTLQRIRDFHRDFLGFNPQGILLVQATYPNNTSIREHLRSIANHENLFYVDLYDPVMQLGPERLRLPYDGHWTPEVHDLSAQALFQTIHTLEAQRSEGTRGLPVANRQP